MLLPAIREMSGESLQPSASGSCARAPCERKAHASVKSTVIGSLFIDTPQRVLRRLRAQLAVAKIRAQRNATSAVDCVYSARPFSSGSEQNTENAVELQYHGIRSSCTSDHL